MIDLGPVATQVAALISVLGDEQLSWPTPCDRTSVGDLVDHVATLSVAFRCAAAKNTGDAAGVGGPPPRADAANLDPDWRTVIPERVRALAASWRDPAAWRGMTRVGGQDLPAEVAGPIALDELVLHGWDLARSVGAPFDCSPAEADVCLSFVSTVSGPGQEAAREGLFGPVLPVPPGATPFERLLLLSGRQPGWRAAQPVVVG